MSRPLNPRESRFVDEYLVDLKQTAAAIRAGYSKATARTTACHLLSRPIVVEAINERMKERAARVRIDQDEVLRDLVAVFRADAASLSEYRRTCCRYCYGEDNRYQRTKGEMERDREAYAKLVREAQKRILSRSRRSMKRAAPDGIRAAIQARSARSVSAKASATCS